MSITDVGSLPVDKPAAAQRELASASSWTAVRAVVTLLASLQLTVFLFALSIVLVLAGTLAQIDHDIWYVIHNYFRCWIAFIELKIFFPRDWNVAGVFPFAGGWLLGTMLGANLLVAHILRFKVTGTGNKLKVGLAFIATGILLTYLVVQSGLDGTIESELSPAFCRGLWHALRFLLGMTTLGLAYWLVLVYHKSKQSNTLWLWWLGATACLLLGSLAIWLFVNPEAQLDASGLRILWQLIKATSAGLVLLAGCHWVFGRRAGIVLLHGGIALMMFNELFTGLHAEEAHMRLVEGQTLDYAEDTRAVELVVIDKSAPKEDAITVIPGWMLREAFENKKPLNHPSLPYVVRVVDYLENAELRFKQPGEETPATEGIGLLQTAGPRTAATGVDQQQRVDVPAAYLELLSKEQSSSTGIYLVSPYLALLEKNFAESVELEDKTYELSLRFRRLRKDYSITLVDFQRNTYVGTETPKNFESVVRLQDPEGNVDRQARIWMNNPLRYGGDTLYQSGFDPDNERYTDLQVVTNTGWMIPYVACMIVGIGMLVHFGSVMLRFLRRQEKEAMLAFSVKSGPSEETKADGSGFAKYTHAGFLVPALVVLAAACFVASRARPVDEDVGQMQIHEFGKLPVAYGGRVQPMDTLARNTLQFLSGGQTFRDRWGNRQPAIRWLIDTVAQADSWRDHRVFRIENLDVLQILDLKPRKGLRYSFNEMGKQAEEFDRQASLARAAAISAEENGKPLELTETKILELRRKLDTVLRLIDVFSLPSLSGGSPQEVLMSIRVAERKIKFLEKGGARPVPPDRPAAAWETVMAAELHGIYAELPAIAPAGEWRKNEASRALSDLLVAYRETETQKFNEQLEAYQEMVEQRATAEAAYDEKLGGESSLKPAERLNLGRVGFEAYFNHLSPFYLAMVLYVFAFLLIAMSWLGWTTSLNRSAYGLLWFTFAFHTFALVCRVYISGRPPVTNLYSSAVFIGWAAVLFALVFEKIYRFGIGNLLAVLVGFPTLFIAHNLAGDGDTFMVLQAVLDTQFWLATHVVCITLGYSTTFLAGMLGVIYILMAHVLHRLDQEQCRQIVRMTYGTLCFATLFSFVGTVLGGLWADDSWGRFWGWDPKENGALMIVIWNALVLHARWGAMVRHRGLAVLAVFGNVVTAWSWFGVNQLGVGLHAYGFTEGRNRVLFLFVTSQLAIMTLGCLPGYIWGNTASQNRSVPG
ncbi:MAG: cytochrome c biogenesis protein CcsA [Pirellulales bacterium]|nr:cytochrome c biogenesis protein CcsA [Pirellulales bacterium]